MLSKDEYQKDVELELNQEKEQNLYKSIHTNSIVQNIEVNINGKALINFHTHNYLGLSFYPELQNLFYHKEYLYKDLLIYRGLEQKITTYLQTEDTFLYASVFDVNGGIFDPLFTTQDIILSDELNSFSLMDKLALSKSEHYRYRNNDIESLEAQLKKAATKKCRYKIIVTEGVFSMKGNIADLHGICNLAQKYNALVMVDDSHATGFIGKTGRGTHEYNNVIEKVDIIVSTLNSDLGGFISGKKEIINLLRNRLKKESYSNKPPIEVVSYEEKIIEKLSSCTELLDKIKYNSAYLRTQLKKIGFDVVSGESAIISAMLYDYQISQKFSDKLLENGINVINLFYPVVPKGKARVLLHVSALHTVNHLDKALLAFTEVGKGLGVIT